MGKIILEFDNIEEQDEAQTAVNASKWKNSVFELDQYYRSVAKYSEVDSEIEQAKIVREKIREILFDNELIL
jgi:hypothetical protein